MMLLDRIESSASQFPDKVAISCPVVGELSVADLVGASASIGEQLTSYNIGTGERVAIYARRSAGVITAIHAALSVGAAYVPVFHGTPLTRLTKILSDCRPAALICDGKSEGTASQAITALDSDTRLISLDLDSLQGARASRGFFETSVEISTDSIFSILYTSGSTGDPKGVVLSHGNLTHYVDWAIRCFDVSDEDTIFSTAPFHFDMSAFDIFVALSTGARLAIASEKECLFPKALLKRLADEKGTVWKAVSPLLANIARSVDLSKVELPSLRALVFSGDRIPIDALRDWMAAFPVAAFYNGYGPTEATGMSCCYRVAVSPVEDETVPIGKGRYPGEVALVGSYGPIDAADQPGEIVISGPGVADGYWQDPVKTEAVFKIGTDAEGSPLRVYRTGDVGYLDENGNIVFVGRRDRQVKHQGFRIELDDIEAALRRMSGIVDAAVVLVDGNEGPSNLVAYFETDSGIDEARARMFLLEQLPAYMVPREVYCLESLPRGDRGKVDYMALAERA